MLTQPTGAPLSVLAEAAWERFGADSTTIFEGRRYTAGQLGARARRLAAGLAAAGVRAGDRVAVCMANCPEVIVTYHALWRIGVLVTPALFLLSEAELRHLLTDSGAAAVLATPEFVPKVTAAGSGLGVRIVTTGSAGGDALPFAELEAGPEAPLVPVDPTGPAALLYTGGTTGRAKGVLLSHDVLSSAAWSATLAGSDEEFAVSLLPLPLAHSFGLLVATMALHALHPTTSVLMRWFDAAQWLHLAARERVQISPVVPTMLRLLAAQPIESHDLSALRRLVSGSAPLPGELRTELAARLPHVELVEGYGCTETAALVTSNPVGRGRPGSVGPPAPGTEVRIEAFSGGAAAPGEDGEICVRGPQLMSGYWHAPEQTTQVLRDGWFHTGDIGHVDEDGYLYVVDRIKDLVIRGGFNVYPRDVEEVLLRHPAVGAAAVVGRPDRERGEEVVAFVALRPSATATPGELREYARAHLSAVKYPREVHIVDALPLTSIGKLDRKALRTFAAASADRIA